ncbi:hypothetical protein CHISP_1468 [Chitinispirillum alkaliphilum]|nr:hypothetical protein CHISP_1468 [Chitinispirillum alkaliphilum]
MGGEAAGISRSTLPFNRFYPSFNLVLFKLLGLCQSKKFLDMQNKPFGCFDHENLNNLFFSTFCGQKYTIGLIKLTEHIAM